MSRAPGTPSTTCSGFNLAVVALFQCSPSLILVLLPVYPPTLNLENSLRVSYVYSTQNDMGPRAGEGREGWFPSSVRARHAGPHEAQVSVRMLLKLTFFAALRGVCSVM